MKYFSRKSVWTLVTLVAIAALAGCGGSSSDDDDTANDDDTVYDPDECDSYEPGMERSGEDGEVKIELLEADPAPPDRGDNLVRLMIRDADGDPVEDADVTVSPFMPAHGHGTNPADFTGEATGTAGVYEVGPFELFMPGTWTVNIHVRAEGGIDDIVHFAFCVEG